MNSVTNPNTNFVQTHSWVDHLLEYRALQEQRDYETRYVEDYDTVEGFQWSAAEVQYRHEQGTWDYGAIHREDKAYEAIEAGDIYAWVDAELERRAQQERQDYEARNVEDLEDEDEDEDEGEMQHYCRNCNTTFGISCLEGHQSVCHTLPTELAQELSLSRPVLERSRNIGNPIPMALDLGDLDIDVEFEDEALLRRKRQKYFHEYEAIPMERSDDDDIDRDCDDDDAVSSVSDEEKQAEDIETISMDISDDDTVSCASNAEGQVGDLEEEADYDLAPRRLFDDEMDDEVEDNWNLEEYVLPTGGVLVFNQPSAQEIQWQNQHIEYDDRVFDNDIVAAINENELIERQRYEYNLYTLEVIWEHGQLVVTEEDAEEVARLRREIAEYEARIIT